jgi:hypothetical protein
MGFGPSTSSKLEATADKFIDMNEHYQKYLLSAKPQRRNF